MENTIKLLHQKEEEVLQKENKIVQIENSTSWKITEPLRALRKKHNKE